MKKKKNSSYKWWLIGIIVILALPIVTGNSYLYKMIRYNFADIDDYKIFDNNTITAATGSRDWQKDAAYTTEIPDSLNQYLTSLQSIALLVVQDEKIKVERYWQDYNDSSLSGSFSMAKSFTSLLIGAAIYEGKIASVNDLVNKYLPEFKGGQKSEVKIIDLLTMSSGSDWNEDYANPFSITTRAYYGTDISQTAQSVNIVQTPGSFFSYKSGDTQLLGLIVEKATGKTLAAYASEKLWKPIGAQHDALWSVDKTGGNEKAYCCFNSNARDFARIGQLMLDSGRVNDQKVIDNSYFSKSITACMIPDESGKPCNYYGYQWWIIPNEPDIFYARGILGQYIICIPSKKMIIVRLGEKRDEKENNIPKEVLRLIEWGKKL